jgi:predicted methyltransferase
VADIVSPIWHDEKERDNANESTQLVRLLGIKSGLTLADIGAGSGYYVVRLSPIVGPQGRIIAEDVVPKYLRGLQSRVRDLGLQNVVITLGEPHDPRLPADSLDIAILVHM